MGSARTLTGYGLAQSPDQIGGPMRASTRCRQPRWPSSSLGTADVESPKARTRRCVAGSAPGAPVAGPERSRPPPNAARRAHAAWLPGLSTDRDLLRCKLVTNSAGFTGSPPYDSIDAWMSTAVAGEIGCGAGGTAPSADGPVTQCGSESEAGCCNRQSSDIGDMRRGSTRSSSPSRIGSSPVRLAARDRRIAAIAVIAPRDVDLGFLPGG
jgi:hypothetical protein